MAARLFRHGIGALLLKHYNKYLGLALAPPYISGHPWVCGPSLFTFIFLCRTMATGRRVYLNSSRGLLGATAASGPR